jgi:hypothetical protein
MGKSFIVQVTPQIYLHQFVRIDSEGEKRQIFDSIDINWFESIRFVQDDSVDTTHLVFDFTSDPGLKYEIHDCFCGNFLELMKALARRNRRSYQVNSNECIIEYEEMGKDVVQTTWIKNNKIHNKIITDGKPRLYGEKSMMTDIRDNLKKLLKYQPVAMAEPMDVDEEQNSKKPRVEIVNI